LKFNRLGAIGQSTAPISAISLHLTPIITDLAHTRIFHAGFSLTLNRQKVSASRFQRWQNEIGFDSLCPQ
jgi:hypothetical protein